MASKGVKALAGHGYGNILK